MRNNKILKYLVVMVLLLNVISYADTLILKDGTVLQGTMISATQFLVQFEVEGEIREIKINDISNITFTPRTEGSLSAATNTLTGPVTIPASTKITARTTERISTASHPAGAKVTAELELDIILNNQIIVPKGSTLYGTVTESIGGRRIGKQSIAITFNEIVVNGQAVSVVTDPIGAEGGRGSAARLVGASALIGAAAGDAGKGAAVGAGLSLLAGGNHIQIPQGTLFDLVIKQNVNIE
jgi:hypothetical protein